MTRGTHFWAGAAWCLLLVLGLACVFAAPVLNWAFIFPGAALFGSAFWLQRRTWGDV